MSSSFSVVSNMTSQNEDISFFRREGYQIFRKIIPLDVVEYLYNLLYGEIETVLKKLAAFGVSQDPKSAGRDIVALLSSGNLIDIDYSTRVLMTGHFPTEVRLSEAFWNIARSIRLQSILREIFQSDRLNMHLPPMARYILPGNSDAGVPPHQDIAYNGHLNDFVTVWLPLVQIDADCGGVTIYEGVKDGVVSTTETVRNGVWIKGISTDGLRSVDCTPMLPGDVLIFNPYVIHGSMPNISDRVRLSVDCRFFGGLARSEKHYLDMSEWTVINPALAGDSK